MAEQFETKRYLFENGAPDWIVASSAAEARRLVAEREGYDVNEDHDAVEDYTKRDPKKPLKMTMDDDDVRPMLESLRDAGADMRAVLVEMEVTGKWVLDKDMVSPTARIVALPEEWAKLPAQFLCSVNY